MVERYIEDPHRPVRLELVIKGPVFEEGLPIPLTIKTLEAVQGIFDRAYLELALKRKMSAQERSLFFLRSNGIQRGSLFTELGLAFSAAQPLLPFVSNLGPHGVWEYTKQTFDFLKLVFGQKKEGAPVTVTLNGDGSTVNVNTGSQTFTFNGPVFNIANSSLPHYEFLANQLAPTKVTDFRLGESGAQDIHFDLRDEHLFDLPTKIEERQHRVRGEIFEFDKYSGTGRLSVFDNQDVRKGEYRFSVIGKQKLSEYIEAMLRQAVEVICLEETVDHPLGGRRVVALQVLSVNS